MKEIFEMPMADFVIFGNEDVITTSYEGPIVGGEDY